MTYASKERDSSGQLLCGMFFILVGLGGWWFGRNLEYGSLQEMGPGYLPFWCSVILLSFGTFFFVSALRSGRPANPMTFGWRQAASVLGGVLLFSLLVERLGFAMTVFIASLTIGLGSKDTSWIELLVISMLLVVMTVTIFVYGLGMPIKVLP